MSFLAEGTPVLGGFKGKPKGKQPLWPSGHKRRASYVVTRRINRSAELSVTWETKSDKILETCSYDLEASFAGFLAAI